MAQFYGDYLKSEEWRIRRDLIKSRDHYRCRLCHSTESLQVHHATYKNKGNEKDNDLITLCGECHAKFHQEQEPSCSRCYWGKIWVEVLQDLADRGQSIYYLLRYASFTPIISQVGPLLPGNLLAFQIGLSRPTLLLSDTDRELVGRLMEQRSGQRIPLNFVRDNYPKGLAIEKAI